MISLAAASWIHRAKTIPEENTHDTAQQGAVLPLGPLAAGKRSLEEEDWNQGPVCSGGLSGRVFFFDVRSHHIHVECFGLGDDVAEAILVDIACLFEQQYAVPVE